jgi:hypothetical protein
MICDHKFVGPPRCAKCGVHISELRAQMLEEQRTLALTLNLQVVAAGDDDENTSAKTSSESDLPA